MVLVLSFVLLGLGIGAAAEPVVLENDIPDTWNTGEPIEVSLVVHDQDGIYSVVLRYGMPGENNPPYALNLIDGNQTTGTFVGTIPAYYVEGTVHWEIIVDFDNEHTIDMGHTAIRLPEEGGVPWSLVLMVIIMVVVFAVIEITLKPGIYMRRKDTLPEDDDEDNQKEEKEPDQEEKENGQ